LAPRDAERSHESAVIELVLVSHEDFAAQLEEAPVVERRLWSWGGRCQAVPSLFEGAEVAVAVGRRTRRQLEWKAERLQHGNEDAPRRRVVPLAEGYRENEFGAPREVDLGRERDIAIQRGIEGPDREPPVSDDVLPTIVPAHVTAAGHAEATICAHRQPRIVAV